jgi:hypothetical protein
VKTNPRVLAELADINPEGGAVRSLEAGRRLRDLVIRLGDLHSPELRDQIEHGYVENLKSLFALVGYRRTLHQKLEPYVDGIFRIPADLDQERREQIDALGSARAPARLGASKWFLSNSHKTINVKNVCWFMDPRVTSDLADRVSRERDPKVHRNLAIALSMCTRRMLPDERTFDTLKTLLAHGDPTLRMNAILGLAVPGQTEWAWTVPMVADKAAVVRRVACGPLALAIQQSALDRGRTAGQVWDALVAMLEGDRDANCREAATRPLLALDFTRAAPLVRKAARRENAFFRDAYQRTLDWAQGREAKP